MGCAANLGADALEPGEEDGAPEEAHRSKDERADDGAAREIKDAKDSGSRSATG